jgi:hypothetical protein
VAAGFVVGGGREEHPAPDWHVNPFPGVAWRMRA